MPLEVSFHNPDFPDGMEFDVGVGVPIPNGGSVTLTEDQELLFVASHSAKVKDYYKESELVKVGGKSELNASHYEQYLGLDVSAEPEVEEDEVTEPTADEGVNP